MMEWAIAVLVGSVVLLGLITVLWKVVSAAVDNAMDWLIHTFGNESAAREVEAKWREKEGQ